MVEAMNAPARIKARRMRLLRRQVFEHDIDEWARAFLDDLDRVIRGEVEWPSRPPAGSGGGHEGHTHGPLSHASEPSRPQPG